jgi:hypothetical protein
MAEHTYARDMRALSDQTSVAPFSNADRREVYDLLLEAIGYARGRMDATQDHHLPWCGIDPLDFGASFARHAADAKANHHTGTGSTMRKDIRSAWESFVVNGRVTADL